ncbi:MAG: hypothetical protein UX60_C0028G0002 [Berkelbacteria bacterium GW2011_GWA2_46_7]|uniref:Uncharacterized protein n=1 Tax=Berkelbacteria bacterium GW2011_GWA2_46_7 TaxID=1618335 RepID=A0A0G1QEV9_9BACT|nr:MAG: hypothetical protein UX60_C0028G0002 [Berkelbacteria bacterium GW2011_GWA2_46_7]
MVSCVSCGATCEVVGSNPERFDCILPLCLACHREVESRFDWIVAENVKDSALKTHNGLVGRLFQSAEISSLGMDNYELPSHPILVGYWLLALSAKQQGLEMSVLMSWCGNSYVEPVINGLKMLNRPLFVG